ncbi:MAG TPA: ATP-binding protein [Pseudonocardia sp.]|uniref:sacsin N-terminal ATP-binding-like domain-containing protein n=1 Tax=Pseudonocardia sp. TaxID=60912 RepID=UPI002EDA23F4
MLAAWANSPTRFREDANAEEDLLLGGYADRWLVELAQNAADAAQRAGTPGRLVVRVVPGQAQSELRVANTGAPLDTPGVSALASLRASSKRDTDSVGRFGVGFAAVLGVTSEPRIVSTGGGVVFSTARTAEEVAALPGAPADELRRRGGRPPVLRLCWPLSSDDPPPRGYQTEVRLPVHAGTDPGELLATAESSAADLLLALPWLAEITVVGADGDAVVHRRTDHPDGTVTLEPGPARWLLVRRAGGGLQRNGGPGPAGGRAVEDRSDWTVCWAVPLDAAGRPRPLDEDVLHAPTPSDERLSLPARLLASMPMQPSRRRIRTGPDTDAVLLEAAAGYRELVLALPPADRIALAPRPGFPRSELDSALREAITSALADTAWLPTVAGKDVRPSDGVVLELPVPAAPELTAPLADVVPGLLADSVTGAPRAVLAELGVTSLSLAGLADRLAEVRRPAKWWHQLYAALAPAVDGLPTAREELAALPVPLVDGRTVTGPRTAVALPGVASSPGSGLISALTELRLPALRIVHPDAAHPLLYRLGTAEAGPAELLDHPSVAEAVDRSVADSEDGMDTAALAQLVLGLLGEMGEIGPETLAARPWLAGLALADIDGEPCRADELMVPNAVLAPLLVADAPVGVLAAELAEAYPRRVLTSVGVLDSFALVVDEQPTEPDHELADEELWWDATEQPPAELVAVRDLDLVDDEAWPAALAVLAGDPVYRPALRAAGGYTTWWLARHARLAGRPPRHWRLPSATALAGLFDELPAEVRAAAGAMADELLAAIGVRADAAVRDNADAADLLTRLGDPARTPDAALTWAAYAELADAVLEGRIDPDELDPPERARAMDGSVLDAGRAVLLDRAWLAPVLTEAETVAGRLDAEGIDALAELLDLPLASEVIVGQVVSGAGRECRWAALPEVVAACAAIGEPVPEGTLWLHERLTVELTRPETRRLDVPVWRQGGCWHATDPVRALLAALTG